MSFSLRAQSTPDGTKAFLPVEKYQSVRSGCAHFFAKISSKKKATVAFLGGSITYNPGWRDKVCAFLRERFPDTKFHFIAAGIPSLGSLPHAFRLQRDVLDSGTVDLLFLEAAVNDRANGTDNLTQQRSLEGIVRHALKSNRQMDIILMAFADPMKTEDYNKGTVPVEVANQERIAEHYRLPSINLAKEVRDKIKNGEFSWEKDFKDLHPSPFGQQLYFDAIRELLNNAAAPNGSEPPEKVFPAPLDAACFDHGVIVSPKNVRYDKEWQWSNDWTPADRLPVRDGFVHVPVLQTASAGAALSFRFTGTAVGIGIISGPDAGIVSWSVDEGRTFKDADLYTPWSHQLHLPWFLLLTGGLKKGEHTLLLKISPAKNVASTGYACQLYGFLVNE